MKMTDYQGIVQSSGFVSCTIVGKLWMIRVADKTSITMIYFSLLALKSIINLCDPYSTTADL